MGPSFFKIRNSNPPGTSSEMGNGPRSWNNAKRRLKRPDTAEMKASMAQEVGKAFTKRRTTEAEVAPRPKVQMKRKLQSNEKRVRSLNKLLRQIEELQARVANGEELDEQQSEKLDRLDEVMEELEGLLGVQ